MGNLPRINMEKTGKNIRRFREEKGMSVRQMQEVFGFTTAQAIYKWQNGQSLPTLDNIVVLAMLFGVRIEDILVLDPDPVYFLRKTA